MNKESVKRCGKCGHCRDTRPDAMVWCQFLKMYVVRDSVGCNNYTDEAYF